MVRAARIAAGAGKFHTSDFAEGLRRLFEGVLGMPEPTRERTLGLPPIVSLITPIEPAAGADRKSSIRQFQSSYRAVTAKRAWIAARLVVCSNFRGIFRVVRSGGSYLGINFAVQAFLDAACPTLMLRRLVARFPDVPQQ